MWVSLTVGLLARPWARRVSGFALVALTIALFILNLRRTAERAGRAIAHQMLDAATRRRRSRADLLVRPRRDRF